jgi:hypothetical protein
MVIAGLSRREVDLAIHLADCFMGYPIILEGSVSRFDPGMVPTDSLGVFVARITIQFQTLKCYPLS